LCSLAIPGPSAEGLSAQQNRVAVSEVRAAGQELGDCGELMRIETLEQCGRVFSYRVEHVLDVSQPIRRWEKGLLTPVVPVRFTTEIAGLFQSRHHASDRARGQARDRGQIAAGHGPALA
jgi:hypothetical protein